MKAKIDELRGEVDARLKSAVEGLDCPRVLRRAMAHSLLSGGKRLRPLIVIAASRLFPAARLDPMPAACALEFIHTYSLVHDDLPAMDDDSLRRGSPTCHVAFGEAVAILAGDALLTEAFRLVHAGYGADPAAACAIALEMAGAAGCGGMVGGQVLDVLKEKDPGLLAAQGEDAGLFRVHELKTGALFKAGFAIGGIVGGAGPRDLEALSLCGGKVGLAFQVVDDCLDATGTSAELGKSAGSDSRKGKETFVSIMGIDGALELAGRLKEEALALAAPYGEGGALLSEIIRLSVERRF